MAGPDDNDDRKVKELLDPAAIADLERWFTLPSFTQLAERGVRPEPQEESPEVAAMLKARANALASIDPVLLADHIRRMDLAGGMVRPLPPFELAVDATMTSIDFSIGDRQRVIAEPRDYERPFDLEDQLADKAPQALLRDLHRPELVFDKIFELVDPGAAQRLDGIALVNEVMATSWRAPAFAAFATELAREAMNELRAIKRRPWTDFKVPMQPVTP
jgi:hypothetical protein